MEWFLEFNDSGGYDSMTGAWNIRDRAKPPRENLVATIDQADFGQAPCDYAFHSTEAKTVALLLVAAPKMLSALKSTLDYWESTGFSDCDDGCQCIVQEVRAAITAAEANDAN